MSNPTEQPPTEIPVVAAKPTAVWQDRRGMFQRGKEVHEPAVRRPSQGSAGSVIDAVRRSSTASNNSLVDKPLSNDPASPSYYPTASDSRRRSSTASASLFGNLTHHKRGSEDYATRRASQSEQLPASGGVVAGWYNSVFRGVKKEQQPKDKPDRRGVME